MSGLLTTKVLAPVRTLYRNACNTSTKRAKIVGLATKFANNAVLEAWYLALILFNNSESFFYSHVKAPKLAKIKKWSRVLGNSFEIPLSVVVYYIEMFPKK